jgi:hypothetical protein
MTECWLVLINTLIKQKPAAVVRSLNTRFGPSLKL